MDLLSDLRDVWEGLSSSQPIAPCRPRNVSSQADVNNLAHAIRNPARTDPLVAITTLPGTSDALALDPDVVWQELQGQILLYVIFEHHFTEQLTAALPHGLGIAAGEVRLWWPGVTAEGAGEDHPLVAVQGEPAKALKRLKRARHHGRRRH
jgi:hypothetical protein